MYLGFLLPVSAGVVILNGYNEDDGSTIPLCRGRHPGVLSV